MDRIRIGIVILSVAATAQADQVTSGHSLDVTANAPTIEVLPRNAGRNYVRLPSLEYTFAITALCGANFNPQSFSLSIADSRKTLAGEEMANNANNVELKLSVPARQLAPLAVEGFCVSATDKDDEKTASGMFAETTLTVPAALSAQSALLCVDEDKQEIIYASNPLDITLVCKSQVETTE